MVEDLKGGRSDIETDEFSGNGSRPDHVRDMDLLHPTDPAVDPPGILLRLVLPKFTLDGVDKHPGFPLILSLKRLI